VKKKSADYSFSHYSVAYLSSSVENLCPRSNFTKIFVTRKLESLDYRVALLCNSKFSHFDTMLACDRHKQTHNIYWHTTTSHFYQLRYSRLPVVDAMHQLTFKLFLSIKNWHDSSAVNPNTNHHGIKCFRCSITQVFHLPRRH